MNVTDRFSRPSPYSFMSANGDAYMRVRPAFIVAGLLVACVGVYFADHSQPTQNMRGPQAMPYQPRFARNQQRGGPRCQLQNSRLHLTRCTTTSTTWRNPLRSIVTCSGDLRCDSPIDAKSPITALVGRISPPQAINLVFSPRIPQKRC